MSQEQRLGKETYVGGLGNWNLADYSVEFYLVFYLFIHFIYLFKMKEVSFCFQVENPLAQSVYLHRHFVSS